VITKRIKGRKDGKSSCADALKYGEGLTPDRDTGEFLDKSHRTRLGNFGLVDDGVYIDQQDEMAELLKLAAIEMQATIDMNTRVGADKKMAHFVVSFNQDKPSEAVLRDTEDSMLSAMKLDNNHFATFLHNDNGYWHLHIFSSRIEKNKPHRGNALWQDKTIRDKVCREIEIRHGLQRDNGMHEIKEDNVIVEIPLATRIANREAKPAAITDKARTTEKYSGEKSFQTWCAEIRIGDRLKHAKSWQDLHAAAAAYGCDVKPKGAGFVICPVGEKGGIQLSKVGLKNLPSKYGAFQAANNEAKVLPEATYKPSPTNVKAASHYDRWREAKKNFKPIYTEEINKQREANKTFRLDLRAQQKAELEKIRASKTGDARFAAISVAKMRHIKEHEAIADRFALERQAFRSQLSDEGPGNTFRDYLVIEARKGDNVALELARKYGSDESTDVLRQREANKLKIVASVTGLQYMPAQRMPFKHHVTFSGSVVFDLGMGRTLTDSSMSKRIQLNSFAADSPEAITTALRFATSKFGTTLTLTGSQEFQRRAIEISVHQKLNITFQDPAMEAYKQELLATLTQEKNHVTRTRSHTTSKVPPSNRRDRLHNLSELTLATESKQPEMLLQKNVLSGVANGDEERRNGDGLRRADARGRANRADLSGSNTSRSPDNGVRSSQGVRPPANPARDDIGSSQQIQLPVGNSSIASRPGLSRVAGTAVAEVPVVLHQPVAVDIPSLSAVEWAKSEGVELGDVITNCIGKVEFVFGNTAIIRSGRAKAFEYKITNGFSIVKGQHIAIDKNGLLSVMEKNKIDKSLGH